MWHCHKCGYCSGATYKTLAAHAWNKHALDGWGRGMTEAFLLQYFYRCGGAPDHGVEILVPERVNGSTEPSC